MSDQSEALRLADSLSDIRRWHDLTDDECDLAAAELRRQHSRIEADEALMWQHFGVMKKALHEMCRTVAPRNSFTEAVDDLDSAITALRKRLESSK